MAERVVIDYGAESSAARRAKALLGPPGVLLNTLVTVAAGMTLWAARAPGGQFPLDCFGAVLWGGLVVAWSCKALLGFASWFSTGPGIAPGAGRRTVRWLVLPVLLLSTVLLIWADVPLRVAFRVSRPALQQIVASVPTTQTSIPIRSRAGLYSVERVESIPGGTVLVTNRLDVLFSYAGFAHCPNGAPPNSGSQRFRPLGGAWYAYELHD